MLAESFSREREQLEECDGPVPMRSRDVSRCKDLAERHDRGFPHFLDTFQVSSPFNLATSLQEINEEKPVNADHAQALATTRKEIAKASQIVNRIGLFETSLTLVEKQLPSPDKRTASLDNANTLSQDSEPKSWWRSTLSAIGEFFGSIGDILVENFREVVIGLIVIGVGISRLIEAGTTT